jgi:hypothetical protein
MLVSSHARSCACGTVRRLLLSGCLLSVFSAVSVHPYFPVHDAACEHVERSFVLRQTAVKFGHGARHEVGADVRDHLGGRAGRVAVFTDAGVAQLGFFADVQHALRRAGHDVVSYAHCRVEPTMGSFKEAGDFLRAGSFDAVRWKATPFVSA